MKVRFFKPDIDKWKFIDEDHDGIDDRDETDITDGEKNSVVKGSFRLVNWNLSFAKNCIQACFLLFLIANLFIFTLLTIDFIRNGVLNYFDTYITEVFGLMRDTIGVYIIKSCLENSFKITMSVLSDYIDKKYGYKLDPNHSSDDPNKTTIVIGDKTNTVVGASNTTDNEESYEEQMAAQEESNKVDTTTTTDDSEDGGFFKDSSKYS